MRRSMKILLWLLGVLLALPVLAVAVVFIALNTDPGRRFAERGIAGVTGGQVVVQGLGGRFPDALRLGHLEVHDAQGAWLLADGVVLDWTPRRLLQRVAAVDQLTAARLQLPRLPVLEPSTQPASTEPFKLPVRVVVEHLRLDRAELGEPVLGAAAVLEADGSADLPSLEAGRADIKLRRLDGGGTYALVAQIDPARIDAKLDVAEPDGGLIAHLAALPNLGPLQAAATLSGPRNAVGTTVSLAAGPLRAAVRGTVDLAGSAADVDVTASAPAMAPAPGVSWQAVQVQAHVRGPFTTPDATGTVRVAGIEAAGAAVRALAADIQGNAGRVMLHAVAEGVRLPGPNPDLLAAAPLVLDGDIRLDDPLRPAKFRLSHPLLSVDGRAQTGGGLSASADLRLPDLAPFASLGGADLHGSTALQVRAAVQGAVTKLDVDGTLGLTGGMAPAPALVGDAATIGLSVQLAGQDVTVSRLDVNGKAVRVQAQGTSRAGVLDIRTGVALADLALLAPTVSGNARTDLHIQGAPDNLAVDGTVSGEVGAPGVPRGPVRLALALQGLPGAPAGHVEAEGTLAGAPLRLAVQARRAADGTLHATIDRADWRSLHAEGALTLPPGATLPQGRVELRMARLDDLRPFAGQPLSGGMEAQLVLDPQEARLHADLRNAGVSGSRVGHAVVTARVQDPAGRRVVAASLVADGIDANGTAGSAKLDVTGPQEALSVRTTASLILSGTPAQISGAAVVNAVAKQVALSALQVTAREQTVRLLAPATIRFSDGVAVDRLRLGMQQAVLEVAGRLAPRLDATVTLRTPASIAAIAGPDYALDGALTLDARLTGTPAQPAGTVRLSAAGLRMRTGPGRALPPASVTATAQLAGTSARLDARVAAGNAQVSLTGQAPLGAGPLNLRAAGTLDLALLDPILTPGGRRARGRVAIDAAIAGTAAAPRLSGTAQLAGGEVQDFGQGVRVTDLAASLRADGDTVRIASLTGRAGPGSIAASGSIGMLAPGLPVDLTITLRNARPLESDRLTADLDADLTVRGPVAGGLRAGGSIVVRRAEIRIPEHLSANVVVLDVRRPGQRPPAPTTSAPVNLDLTVRVPSAVFVRGRGVDAELAGELRIRGSSTAPQVAGGLEMRRGTISVAGTTLSFSRGKVGFEGTGVTGRIDPTLDFAADSTAGGMTATLAITGYASRPKITLSSVPDLPQDEVLAYLIFKRSAKELGPFQIAEIAAAVASLSGVTSGSNPLESVRRGLGLDRLSLGAGTASNSAPTVEAGRYVANGVYVGAKQGTTGAGTQATVQIDIAKGLKVETDVGSGQGGNQVGLTYQFEY